MLLNLHDIIDVPGSALPFQYEPDFSDLHFELVEAVQPGAKVTGRVENHAGLLVLTAELDAVLECLCARCLQAFIRPLHQHIEATLTADGERADDPDLFPLDGDHIDVDEVVTTAFVLNMDQKMLCREDCKGLCERCGKNLNDGPCACKAENDPRLAVLGQLLEKE